MKPIKLIINAFGPYKDREEIDFLKLNNKSLFLITGPTGAGKSTIFDALTFALYGRGNLEGKGYEKDTRSFKSDFASIESESYIEFKFEVKGREYFIRRSPSQLVKKLRGEGLREKSEEAVLEYKNSDGNKIVKERLVEIREDIEEIIGLNLEQFRQIMIIPQGQFRKVISSDTKERKEILQKLFDINLCSRIQEGLKEKSRLKEKEIKDTEIKIEEYFKNLNTEIKKEEIVFPDINQRLKYFNDIKDELLYDSENLKSDIVLIEKEEARLNEEIGRAEVINNIIESIDKLKTKLSLEKEKESEYLEKEEKYSLSTKALKVRFSEEKYIEIKDDLEKEEKDRIRTEDLILKLKCKKERLEKKIENSYIDRNKRDKIAQEISRLEELKDSTKELDDLNKEIIENKEDLNRIILSGKKLKRDIQELEKNIENEENLDNLREEIDHENRDLMKRLSDLNRKSDKIGEIDRKFSEHFDINEKNKLITIKDSNTIKEIQSIENNIIKVEKEYKYLNEKYNEQIIYRLRKSLKEGDSCPVCGSLEHGDMEIIQIENLISDEDIKKIELKLKNIKKEYDELRQVSKENNIIKTENDRRLVNLIEDIKYLCNEIGIEIEEDDDARAIKEKFTVYGMNLLQENKKIDRRYKETELEFKNLKRKIEKNKDSIKKREEKCKEIERQRDQYKEKIMQIEKSENRSELIKENIFGNKDIKVINSYYEAYVDIIEKKRYEEKKLSERFESDDNELEKLKSEIEKKSGELISQKNRIKNLYLKEEERKTEYLKTLRIQGFMDEDIYKINYIEEDKINILKADIESYRKRVYEYEKLLESQEEQIKGQKYSDTKILNKKIENLIKEKKEKMNLKNDLDSKILLIKDISNKIRIEYEENQREILEFEKIKDLSSVANRNNNKNISFEAYVLSAYLDEILVFTNQRFNKMTDGRYEIYRREDVVNRSSESGLDLEILDNYSSKRRDIKTLSGGESFKASLSMALGLSDVVKMYLGGIGLDTIFIDEGFGTLDSDSLDMAINSLIEIQNQGRLVGIISHVNELKERIPDKIEIEMDSSGSKIRAFENL